MNVVWGSLLIAAVCAVAVSALLLVRRRAPEGGFFEDGDRAAGVFGVLAVVLFASALFFGGMSTKLTTPRLRVAMLSIGCAIFFCTALWMVTSPISLSV